MGAAVEAAEKPDDIGACEKAEDIGAWENAEDIGAWEKALGSWYGDGRVSV